MPPRKTHEQFVNESYEKYGDEFTILGTYINAQTDILVLHNICNAERLVNPNSFLKRSMCPKCANNLKYTTDTFKQKMFELVGVEYSLLGEYKNAHTNTEIMHNLCGTKYLTKPYNFINGKRCKKCLNEKLKQNLTMTHEQFCNKVYELYGEEYDVLGKYFNAKTNIIIKHNICDYTWSVSPYNFTHEKSGCPKCSNRLPHNTEIFAKRVYDLVGCEYTVLGEYSNAKTKIKLQHNICNSVYFTTPDVFISGSRCPVCNQSKGEHVINEFLKKKHITFEREYNFGDLKDRDYLRFDFAVFDKENKLISLIEYDGEFHYIPILGDNVLFGQQKRDKMKDDYCIKNNIKLVRIPYWDFDNINKILEEEIIQWQQLNVGVQ